jgi:hypothetical protein
MDGAAGLPVLSRQTGGAWIFGMLKTKCRWGIFLRTSKQSHSPNSNEATIKESGAPHHNISGKYWGQVDPSYALI